MKHQNRKRSIWEIICITGVPWILITIVTEILVAKWWYSANGRDFEVASLADIKGFLGMAAVLWIYVVLKNSIWIGTDKRIGLFTWIGSYYDDPDVISGRKRKAQYPKIPPELLSDEPDGLVLGVLGKKKYIRVPLKKGNILNAIIMGSTGCGKSVLLLTMLIYQLHHKPKKNEDFQPMVFYCLDIKPELAKKSCIIKGNKKIHVMNPLDRSSYGWDVYYRLHADSSDDEILAELELIARALIDAGKSTRNEFFYQSGRNIFIAIMFFTFKQGKSFLQGLMYLMDGSLLVVINRTLEKVEDNPEYQIVRMMLAPYIDKKGEGFEGIEMSVRESMGIFMRQNVKFFLDGNPRKASPLDLEEHISVFFSIHENLLDEYKTILRLTTSQVMAHCKERPENAHMITLVIDEAAVVKTDFSSFMATSRSHQINTILCFQGISQIEKVWGKEEARTMIELCRVIEVLSCSDPNMAKLLGEWAGRYAEKKISKNHGSDKSHGSQSVSFEDKPILTQSDIMDLQDNREAIAFVKGQYMRLNVDGARYYNIPKLNRISAECVAINENADNKRRS